MDLAEYGAVAAYWEGQIDTGELCQMLKPLTAQQTNALTSGPIWESPPEGMTTERCVRRSPRCSDAAWRTISTVLRASSQSVHYVLRVVANFWSPRTTSIAHGHLALDFHLTAWGIRCASAGLRSRSRSTAEISLQVVADDPLHNAASHFLGDILVASTVGNHRRIKRRLMIFQGEFHSGGINLQNFLGTIFPIVCRVHLSD